jgi:molybdopterin-guanine dinucleotide biosynthesis protein A
MGTDKAFLELADKALISRAIELAREATTKVQIVGDAEKFAAYGPVIEDVYRDHGPLGGIHAALANSEAEWNLMLAVDLPFLPARFLKYLLARAESSNAMVTVPSIAGYFQPLCAVYRKQFLNLAERALAEGRNKIDTLFREVSICVVSEEGMAANGFDSSIFRNVNTPQEWQEAMRDFGADSH